MRTPSQCGVTACESPLRPTMTEHEYETVLQQEPDSRDPLNGFFCKSPHHETSFWCLSGSGYRYHGSGYIWGLHRAYSKDPLIHLPTLPQAPCKTWAAALRKTQLEAAMVSMVGGQCFEPGHEEQASESPKKRSREKFGRYS